jgi:pilus assembly protein CpaB
VTLIVSPQDALALNWAMTAGADLVLTLRNPDDPSDNETDSVTLQFLIDNYDISVPTKLSFGTEPAIEAPSQSFPPQDPGAQDPAPQQ